MSKTERTRKNKEDLRQLEGEIRKDVQDQHSRCTERLEEMKKTFRRELGTDDSSQDGLNQFDGIDIRLVHRHPKAPVCMLWFFSLMRTT